MRCIQFRNCRAWDQHFDVLIDGTVIGNLKWDKGMGHWIGKTRPRNLSLLGFRRTLHAATGLPIVLFGQDLSEVVEHARRKLGKLHWKRGVLDMEPRN